jgi:hypothetical protein
MPGSGWQRSGRSKSYQLSIADPGQTINAYLSQLTSNHIHPFIIQLGVIQGGSLAGVLFVQESQVFPVCHVSGGSSADLGDENSLVLEDFKHDKCAVVLARRYSVPNLGKSFLWHVPPVEIKTNTWSLADGETTHSIS